MSRQQSDQERDERLPQNTPGKPTELAEFLGLLSRLDPGDGARKLQFDLARDAAIEAFRQLQHRLQRLEARVDRYRAARKSVEGRHMTLLQTLAVGAVVFPRPSDWPAPSVEELTATFHRLRAVEFPRIAELIQAAADKTDPSLFVHVLVDEILVNGNAILVEHLTRHSRAERTGEQEQRFLEEFRHHVAGYVNQALARHTGFQMTPDVGSDMNGLLRQALRFLFDLLTSQPPVRLLIPAAGEECDPQWHERHSGRPLRNQRLVKAVWFPGLVRYGVDGGLIEKARVVTQRVNRSAQHPPDEDD